MPQNIDDLGPPSRPTTETPKQRMRIRRISGTPRMRSMKTTASARMGKKAGPRSERAIATTRAKKRISTSAPRNIRMSSQKPDSTAGHTSTNASGLKNWRWTCGHASEVRIAHNARPKKTTDDTKAIRAPRAPSSRARRRDPFPGSRRAANADGAEGQFTAPDDQGSLAQDGDVPLLGEPFLGQRIQRSLGPQLLQSPVDAGLERAVVLHEDAELVGLLLGGGQRSDDGGVGHLDGRDVVGGRQVEDDGVDLTGVECRLGVGVGVVH